MDYSEAWPGGPKFFTTDKAPRLTTDTMLLADFVKPRRGGLCGDIGTGSGALILLLAEKLAGYIFIGFELSPESAGVAARNFELGAIADRAQTAVGDIAATHRLFGRGSFDMLVSNPPYFPPGSISSPSAERDISRRGMDLPELLGAAAFLLKNGGTFSLVYRAARLAEVFTAMSGYGIEPKRLRLYARDASSPPSLALIEGRRGARPGIELEPALFKNNPDGSETDEYRRVNHK